MSGSLESADVALRDQLTGLHDLLALSMVMTDCGDERQILDLATTAVPSLGRCRLGGVYLDEGGWTAASGPCADPEVRGVVEAQFAVLTTAGGAVAVHGEEWGWAYPLRSLEGDYGYLVVSADDDLPMSGQFVLRVLAQQVGIALANARLHARDRATAAQLRTANATLADTVAALERSTAIHARLTQVAAAGEGQEGIAQAVHELTGYPVAVEDRHGNLRAWAGPGRPDDPYPKEAPGRREQVLARGVRAGEPIRDDARLLAVARPSEEVLGVLVLIDPESSAGEQEQMALEHGGLVLAVELAHMRSLAETELRLGRDLVEDLLAGIDEESALERAAALGYDLERVHRVVVVAPLVDLGPGGEAFFHAVRRAARGAGVGSLLVDRDGRVVVLSDTDRPWAGFRQMVVDEPGGVDCRVGVGGPCEGLADFPRSHQEAQLALKLQEASGGDGRATVFDQLGVYEMLADLSDVARVERFAATWLGPLIAYDTENGSSLVLTLWQYLERGGSYTDTARALAVHRSTLKYRLQRIREISHHDLTDADTRFKLQLASRAWRTLEALRS